MLAQIRAINNDLPRITPGLIRSAPDSLTLAGPVLNAIRREDWETLRRKGDVVVPEGYQSVPFMRGDPISAPPPAAAEQSDPRPVASPTEPEKPLQPVAAIESEGSSLDRSEDRRVGQEGVSTVRYRW